ncbi:calcium-binding protein [Mesorhizobium sp. BAC0120]|uniref:calcium-binding protein n=1 Tax=Mesorhizobium sp. BAC0120 TaxID=3090670 RepID=UPI00298CAE6B|nr:calcium-binding protein [Mesorhizobium sp. BAC0120]MDW6025287.1 calcium-binding protein [Mesorhizobium sp. BAC0120]
MTTLHYTSGGSGEDIARAGFNLADVQSVAQLNALPDGMKGLVWLNAVDGATSSFKAKVDAFKGNDKLFGFFLVDEPDPTGKWGTFATAANLKAESDYIHANLSGAKTFITMMNMGSSAHPSFEGTFNPANTGIDYYGLDPYPIRTGGAPVDYDMIDRTVDAAVASGIPISKIVPVYQTFGGGEWHTDTGGQYVLPTAAQMQTMLDHWQANVPSPGFDYAYVWGSQRGSTTLPDSQALMDLFLQHNGSDGAGSGAIDPTPTGATNGADILWGTAGADVMKGLGGNDTYHVNHAGDKVVEAAGGGTDKVLSSVSWKLTPGSHVEVLATENAKGTTKIDLTGNELSQQIIGNLGANYIDGKGGSDVLTGGRGADHFVFSTALGNGNVDRITDFWAHDDTIVLDHTVFKALGNTGKLAKSAFVYDTSGVAHDANDRIMYETDTGKLYYDADGSGPTPAVHFADLTNRAWISAADFVIV